VKAIENELTRIANRYIIEMKKKVDEMDQVSRTHTWIRPIELTLTRIESRIARGLPLNQTTVPCDLRVGMHRSWRQRRSNSNSSSSEKTNHSGPKIDRTREHEPNSMRVCRRAS
jgi:hypothetical protein